MASLKPSDNLFKPGDSPFTTANIICRLAAAFLTATYQTTTGTTGQVFSEDDPLVKSFAIQNMAAAKLRSQITEIPNTQRENEICQNIIDRLRGVPGDVAKVTYNNLNTQMPALAAKAATHNESIDTTIKQFKSIIDETINVTIKALEEKANGKPIGQFLQQLQEEQKILKALQKNVSLLAQTGDALEDKLITVSLEAFKAIPSGARTDAEPLRVKHVTHEPPETHSPGR
jgi:hypothetical protein